MKKALSLLLALVLAIGAIPVMVGYTDKEGASVSVGDWLSLIDSEFGMTYYEQSKPYYANISSGNRYFAAVQTAAEWDIISANEQIDLYKAVKADFMAATLVRAAKITTGGIKIKNANKLYSPVEVGIAAGNGIVSLTKSGKFDNCKITLKQGKSALAVAKNIWANKSIGNKEATVKVADNVCDLSSLPAVDNSGDKYKVKKTADAETDILPVTPSTSRIAKGNVIVLPASSENPFGAVRKVTSVKTTDKTVVAECKPADVSDVFDEINLESQFKPDFNTAQVTDENGNVINAADYTAAKGFSLSDAGTVAATAKDSVFMSLLKNDSTAQLMQCAARSRKPISINLSVGDYSVKGNINGSTMDFSVSGVVKGVKITKTYHFTNFNLSAKANVNVRKANIKNAYIRVDYNVVDSTKLEGNYNKALAQYGWNKNATIDDVDKALGTDALSKLKGKLQGAADKVSATVNKLIPIAHLEIPIPNMPLATVALDISLRINVDGSIELVVETNDSRGYEIINNRGRAICNTVDKENKLNLGANCQLTTNFGVALKLIGINIIDAGLETGVGADAQSSITWFTAKAEPEQTVTADIPIEVAELLTAGKKYCNVTGDVTVYNIFNVSVGKNSQLMKIIGLTKIWTVYDENNAVIHKYHFDEGNVPKPVETTAETAETTTETTTAVPVASSTQAAAIFKAISAKAGDKVSLVSYGSGWTSSNTAAAVVADDGTLTAVAKGNAVVTGIDANGKAISISVSVTEPAKAANTTVVIVNAFKPAAVCYSI